MQKLSDSPAGPVAGGGSSPELESPSLFGSANGAAGDGPTAYELKFLLPEEQAAAVAEKLRGRLALDPHADPALGGAYRTTSLYTDTPDFAVFRRDGEYGSCKFRVRRYGAAGPVFLERKEKDNDKVRKCRATVPAGELALLAHARPRADWVGAWFRAQVAERRLSPICRVSYERVALMGPTDAGTVRVTFDRNIRGEAASGWDLSPVGDLPELLPGHVVCEFKFRVTLPGLLKEAVEEFGLAPTTVSKYRRFLKAAGLAPAEPAAAAEGNGGAVDG